jgi:hypothetical protein
MPLIAGLKKSKLATLLRGDCLEIDDRRHEDCPHATGWSIGSSFLEEVVN